MWRDDAYLLDMLLATRKVQQFTQGVTWNQFQDDEMLQNAVMRLIQIVGEAARKVSPEFKQAHPEIPWQGIIGMRNRLVHDYFRIEPSRVWEVIEKDLPALIPLIEPLIPPDEPAEKP
jgi:uncharacterized protein with HEPN domain